MTGISRSRRFAAHEFVATMTVALMLGTALGCSQQAGKQKSSGPQKPAAGSTGRLEASDSDEPGLGAEPPDEAWEDSAGAVPAGLTVHHLHYFGFGPPGAGDAPPGRLSRTQFDRENRVIHWPPLLRDKQFSEARYKLDQLFDKRGPGNSGLNSENYEGIRRQCEAMLGILARMMPQLNSEEFVGASRFIKALEDEARFADR